MPLHQTSSLSTTDVWLTALGKTWGRLIAGHILEVRSHGRVVRFDLAQTVACGRPVVCEAHEQAEGCGAEPK